METGKRVGTGMTQDIFTLGGVTTAVILGMAAVTLATRLSGYALARRIAFRGRLKAALEAMPAAILTAIVTPLILLEGPAEAIAGAQTVLAALRLPTLAAIAVGVAFVVGLRLIGF